MCIREVRLSPTQAKEAHTARSYPSFCSMKELRVLLLPPEWDASPSQGYPQKYVTGTHLYTWVERDKFVELSLLNVMARTASNHQPSDLKFNALTTTPAHTPPPYV